MGRFYVKIVDERNNEVLLDMRTDCIVGAALTSEEASMGIAFTNSNAMNIASTAIGSVKAVNKLCEQNAAIAALVALAMLQENDKIRKEDC